MDKAISNEEALQNFLLDIDCLDELLPWSEKFNIFDVLKVSRTEIRHSNMLGWLLDPNENHGIGDLFLRLVLQQLVRNDNNSRYDVFQLLLQDNYSYVVYREWKNIDILLLSTEDKSLIAIENKVGSHEHSNQLNRYREILQKEFPTYTQAYVFLTPDGEKPSDAENWDIMTYGDIVDILDTVLQREEMAPDVKLMLQNYVAVIRRDIVDDQQLIEICNKIYNKHRKALDLIFEHRINHSNLISDTIRRTLNEIAAAGEIIFEDTGKSNTFIIFNTPEMDRLLPPLDADNSSYGTNRAYAYCLSIRDTTVYAYLELGGWNVTEDHKQIMDKIISKFKPKDKNKEDFRYKRIYRTKTVTLDDENMEESIVSTTEQFVRDLLNFEKQLIAEIA